MGKTLTLSLQYAYRQYEIHFLGLALIIAIVAGWNGYVEWSAPLTIVGLISLPWLCYAPGESVSSSRLFLPAILLMALCIIVPVKTVLFFAIVVGGLALVESYYARCGHLPLLALMIISPLSNYILTVFTFPIRLKLSSIATYILQWFNDSVICQGNIITVNGTDFSVDTACMGMSMMGVGLLMGVWLLATYQRRSNRRVSLLNSAGFLLVVFLLLVVANLIRIILLVQFHIMPDTIWHEITGICCFLLYGLLPAAWLIRTIRRRQMTIEEEKQEATVITLPCIPAPRYRFIKNSVIAIGLLALCLYVDESDYHRYPAFEKQIAIEGYESNYLGNAVVRLQNEGSLVYIKAVKGFYSTDHSPMICWVGSGYELNKLREVKYNTSNIFMGELLKNNETLYTAWWFDNGKIKTTSQLEWRWRTLSGQGNFCLVNITARTQHDLEKELDNIFHLQPFNTLLHG